MSAFLFGKLPAHGDFVARGLAPAARDAWDGWLSRGLSQAMATHGDAFADRYGRAPVWRFAFANDAARAGAIACSVDAIGRRFPIVAGCDAPADAGAAAAACEDALYQAFGGGWTADTLRDALDRAEHATGEGSARSGWWTEGGQGFPPRALSEEWPERLIATMLTPVEGRA